MKKSMQRLIGPVLVFLLLGSAAGCQFGSPVEMEEVQGPVVRVHGTKPETITPVMSVTFQATNDVKACRTLKMTGYTVPHRRYMTIWPGEKIAISYSSDPDEVQRTIGLSLREVECGDVTSGQVCQYFQFETAPRIDTPKQCAYKIRSLTIGLTYTGPATEAEVRYNRRRIVEYGYGAGSVSIIVDNVSRVNMSEYDRLKSEVRVSCRWGGFEDHSVVSRPLDCDVVQPRTLGYRIPRIPGDTLDLNLHVRYVNGPE